MFSTCGRIIRHLIMWISGKRPVTASYREIGAVDFDDGASHCGMLLVRFLLYGFLEFLSAALLYFRGNHPTRLRCRTGRLGGGCQPHVILCSGSENLIGKTDPYGVLPPKIRSLQI